MAHGRTPLLVIFLTVFMDLVGFGIVIPLLPAFAKDMAAGPIAIGVLFASYSAMQFLFAPLWGWLSDRHGRRPIILISLLGSTLSYVLFGWACAAGSFTLLLASRTLAGLMGANIPVAQAFIADVTTPEERATGMAKIGMAFGMGFTLGPLVAYLLLHFGIAGPGFGAAVICGLNLLLAFVRLPESHPPENRGKAVLGSHWTRVGRALGTPLLGRLLMMFCLFTVAWSVWETTLADFFIRRFGWEKSQIAWIFVYAGFVMAFVQGMLVRKLRRKMSEQAILRIGLLASGIAFGLLAVPWGLWSAMIALALLAVGFGFTQPMLLALISHQTASTTQGQVLGVSQSLSSLARVIGPLLGYLFIWIGLKIGFGHVEALPYLGCVGLVAVVMAMRGVKRG